MIDKLEVAIYDIIGNVVEPDDDGIVEMTPGYHYTVSFRRPSDGYTWVVNGTAEVVADYLAQVEMLLEGVE